ncbi:hypothetical protein [Mesorhizobium sp.]|uniref:hypothetical protein n=1 Tax=Mesorhizobium sp. TaxID=1871066 RepID=UPI000FEA77E3|nr:hypothetical protein [Mesorhizobium sp.]RWN11467.1 MAG: hypothetical protein EOR87_13045 [Mesorhizobium sp.]RWN19745.1 MAG: hypothetical protein EOR88_11520 [Mesorhizobium sp.]
MPDRFAALISDLESARSRRASDEIENPPRSVAIEALDAVHRYLRDIGVEDHLRAPLMHLLGAMQDLEQGRTNPILAPGPYSPTKQHTRQLDTAEFVMASYAVTLMSEQPGVSTDRALDEMSAVIGTDKNTLREFRKNLGKGRATEAATRELSEWRAIRRNYRDMPVAEFVAIMKDKGRRLHLQKG